MKRSIFAVFFTIIVIGFLGCSANKNVAFKQFYSQAIDFSKNDDQSKSVPRDMILMMTNEEFKKFKDKYFTSRGITMTSPDKDKAVLYTQIPSQYSVESISTNNNVLLIALKKSSNINLKLDGKLEWIALIEIDKTNLKGNMNIVQQKW